MSAINSLAGSVSTALSRGFATLDRAARKMAAAPADLRDGDMTPVEIALASEKEDGLVSGVLDLSLAKMQVGAGAALMQIYKRTTGTLLDMMG
jgi:hypothetical protein